MKDWKQKQALNMDKLSDHAILECWECNKKLTEIWTHNRQFHCKHKWEKLSKKDEGCPKCMLVRKIKRKKK